MRKAKPPSMDPGRRSPEVWAVARSRLTNGEVAELERELDRRRALLHRWLLAASAMGGGPRAVLTQDTLDAVGMPDV